ncbi:alpha/beta fold hydrolase [Niveibacterium sp. 24ML]|uniref:PHA/PHB synthase family protein n=1 Tax=Niveibacterium sp. 24ML TaxID=2985512 RepID=UPI0022705636|nr:alpha/beta fold hydrolase [Niveibacterium sp. 24ML]MCX9157037.1 alpha/beta fold hydrolase [Niveibacterium sp. 24ML]
MRSESGLGHSNVTSATLAGLREQVSASVDPLGVIAPVMHAQLAWWMHPQEFAERYAQVVSDSWALTWNMTARLMGAKVADVVKPQEDDLRFADPVWTQSPQWNALKQCYLLATRHTQDMLYASPGLSGTERRRAAFWWRQWLNAVAPTNYFALNPVAQRAALESHGESLRAGWQNFVDDLRARDIRMADPGDFKVGKNLGQTAGEVVARTRLLELIHYTPTAESVRKMPIVIITPWINKFYVLDLTPKKSMVKYLLDQGFDVFITSWKNPDASMRDVRFDDYLLEGVDVAVQTARAMSGAEQVHAVGYCIGGTALSTYMAWANRRFGPDAMPVAHWTLFTTLVDFAKPGDVEVFVDEGSVRYLTRAMEQRGYLDGKDMATSFRLLRANPLIWQYVVQGYLLGQKPPSFDVLYWNMDTTRMPYAMHAWYLKELYLHNRLIKPDALTVAGEKLDLGRITQPLYAVSAEDDHIAPWRQAFRVVNFVRGEKRFVLSSSGHILGIVNPPVQPPKREYWIDAAHRTDSPHEWRERAAHKAGSWWEDWTEWLSARCGDLVPAPPVASPDFPSLAPAPGAYVLER